MKHTIQTKPEIIQQGAEATIYKIDNKVVKDRILKSYRHPELDSKLIRRRTKSEAKILDKLQEIINVPKLLADPGQGRMIHMQYINGKKLSTSLETENHKEICKQIGQAITKIHDQDIIHGDLTTSNMILKDNKLFLIDFGLSFHSKKIEDKAVDLHLLKQAFEAKHFSIYNQAINTILENYNPEKREEILNQLKKVESRGRYKDKY
ncbi:Kae1-associated kinase Bud32 [Candidatus Pacearchaeota archaeon]|jgi:TP53 regulating kinase-like protein|nr:Kae1-associated kinase Bud32 [Candidatus Pacearchaeota archaeon]|tara:strand:+ start:8228 stop:8848 length:621 start_codon:yes stop_codon:yes gene_type:complete